MRPSSSDASGTARSYLPMNLSCFFIGSRDTPIDPHAGRFEIAGQRGEILRLAGAARRVVLGVEIEHQRLARRGEIDLGAVARGQQSVPAPGRLGRSFRCSLDAVATARRCFAAPRHARQAAASQLDSAAGGRDQLPGLWQSARFPSGATSRIMTSIRVSKCCASTMFASINPASASCCTRLFEPRIEADVRGSAAARGPRTRGRPARPARA